LLIVVTRVTPRALPSPSGAKDRTSFCVNGHGFPAAPLTATSALTVGGQRDRSGSGDGGVVKEICDRDRLLAMWTRAAHTDPTGKGAAVIAALFAQESLSAVGALVDGDLSAGPGGRHSDRWAGVLVPAAERGLAADRAAVGLPADRGETDLADRAWGRPGFVP